MSVRNVKRTPAHEKLLQAGHELLLENSGDLSQVKMSRVVQKANLTSGAFYNVWPSGLSAFQESLLEYALAADHLGYLEDILKGLETVGPETMPLSNVVRFFSAADTQHLTQDPGFRVQVALWARHGSDSLVKDALRGSYQEFAENYEAIYDRVLASYSRRWRQPFNATLFATMLTALAEGLAMRAAVDPDSVRSDLSEDGAATADRAWDVFGLAVAALLTVSSESTNSSESVSVWTVLSELDEGSDRGSSQSRV